jgi:hypothetical protein
MLSLFQEIKMTLRDSADQLTFPLLDLAEESLADPITDTAAHSNDLILFRGDPTLVKKFELSKMADDGLFGTGIYLTDNAIVAEDYAFSARSNCEHIFHDCDNERDAIAALMKRIMVNDCNYPQRSSDLRTHYSDMIYDRRAQGDLDFDAHHDRIDRDYRAAHAKLSLRIMAEAKRILNQRRENLHFHRDTCGNYRMADGPATGYVTSFSLPITYSNVILDADAPLSSDGLKALEKTFLDINFTSFRHEHDFVETFEEWVTLVHSKTMEYAWWDNHRFGGEGKNPSLDQIRNGTYFGLSIFHNLENQKILINNLEEAGYRGLTFRGGVPGSGDAKRGGGGIDHQVYVVWNEEYLHTRRVGSTEIKSSPILTPHEKHMRVSTFNL